MVDRRIIVPIHLNCGIHPRWLSNQPFYAFDVRCVWAVGQNPIRSLDDDFFTVIFNQFSELSRAFVGRTRVLPDRQVQSEVLVDRLGPCCTNQGLNVFPLSPDGLIPRPQ